MKNVKNVEMAFRSFLRLRRAHSRTARRRATRRTFQGERDSSFEKKASENKVEVLFLLPTFPLFHLRVPRNSWCTSTPECGKIRTKEKTLITRRSRPTPKKKNTAYRKTKRDFSLSDQTTNLDLTNFMHSQRFPRINAQFPKMNQKAIKNHNLPYRRGEFRLPWWTSSQRLLWQKGYHLSSKFANGSLSEGTAR